MQVKLENLRALLTAFGYPIYPPKPANPRQVIYLHDKKAKHGKTITVPRLF